MYQFETDRWPCKLIYGGMSVTVQHDWLMSGAFDRTIYTQVTPPPPLRQKKVPPPLPSTCPTLDSQRPVRDLYPKRDNRSRIIHFSIFQTGKGNWKCKGTLNDLIISMCPFCLDSCWPLKAAVFLMGNIFRTLPCPFFPSTFIGVIFSFTAIVLFIWHRDFEGKFKGLIYWAHFFQKSMEGYRARRVFKLSFP